MPRKRTPIRQIREVLRLRFEKQLSERQIAQAVGVGRTTLQGYLRKAAQAQLTWPLPPDLNDEELQKLLYPISPLVDEKIVSKSLPDFLHLHQELKKKGVTLQLLWEEYLQANPQGYQYTQFRVRYRKWENTLEPVMRQSHRAGEKLFVDYAGMTMGVVDRTTGEIQETQIFVACWGPATTPILRPLGPRNYPTGSAHMSEPSSSSAAVPELLIPDNLK